MRGYCTVMNIHIFATWSRCQHCTPALLDISRKRLSSGGRAPGRSRWPHQGTFPEGRDYCARSRKTESVPTST